MEYILNAANDLGYGSIKATLNDEKVKMPSVIAGKKPQDITEPVSLMIKKSRRLHERLS